MGRYIHQSKGGPKAPTPEEYAATQRQYDIDRAEMQRVEAEARAGFDAFDQASRNFVPDPLDDIRARLTAIEAELRVLSADR